MIRPFRFLACLTFAAAVSGAEKSPWWSLQPIRPKVAVPGSAVDYYIDAKLKEKGLTPAPPADARTLIRRLYFDLTGLPPAPEEVEEFTAAYTTNGSYTAYETLVDKLLASPRYGERWARHWLDVVHYGDTHGYDKDQPRPNAWPYRDYVIRAFNEDKPYTRFVQEQIAGDTLFPNTRDGIEALGFIAAGPWDLIGHAEVPETKVDGKIARHLDRDDMVANTMSTFCSMTVHCAQCHDHKFDPISIEDYYNLQSVFAALDRADRSYDTDPAVAGQRSALESERNMWLAKTDALQAKAKLLAGDALTALDKTIASLRRPAGSMAAQYGWHSAIEPSPDTVKWVLVDLGETVALSELVLHPCNDDFAGIGAGFGFPVRYKIEASDDPKFAGTARVIVDQTQQDVPNPKEKAVRHKAAGSARYLRITATKLVHRQNDYIFALAELEVLDAAGKNRALGTAVTSLDSVEAPPRWQRANLTDSWYPGVPPEEVSAPGADVAKLNQARRLLLEAVLSKTEASELESAERAAAEAERKLKALPAPRKVYSGTIHTGTGSFTGTGASGGQPRSVFVLARGDVTRPGAEARPGALSCIEGLPAKFVLPGDGSECQRRAALARWITDPKNPLTWRSIVNRVWQYHFGRGLVDSPNDFGKMGALPSHPELLDWLAADFRDSGGSFKRLHKLIVTSAAYRRTSSAQCSVLSAQSPGQATANFQKSTQIDPDNSLLWRAHRRKLEAEAVRDSLLAVSGLLDLKMGGPAFQDFVVNHPEHSPHYEYHLADLSDPKLHRRSVYRFLARSKPQPWMATMDCADPSMMVDKRTQTITPLQALAQLNNQLTLVAAQKFAERLAKKAHGQVEQIRLGFRFALQREPSAEELESVTAFGAKSGLPAACRVLLNLNEFNFVD
jgi:multidrug efflux pump subunit AcrA (membrane-fusion protein)